MSSSSSSSSVFIPTATTCHPLFSTVLTFLALIFLFFPRFLWTSLLSPPLLLAGFLFLSLLRLGATQRQYTLSQIQSNHHSQLKGIFKACSSAPDVSISSFEESFVQWNVRAPLEVIYEDYEEEEQEDDEEEEVGMGSSIERYPSLSLYYPETDSDSSSAAENGMENVCFMWDEENEDRSDDDDELIEISFHNKKSSELFQLEEENFIEINISPTAFPIFN